jgi:hypothetical protein
LCRSEGGSAGAFLFVQKRSLLSQEPEADGEGEPDEGGEGEDDPGAGAWEPDPEDEGESSEADASDGSAVGIDGGHDAAAIGAVVTGAGLVLFLVSFDEAGACGKDGGKGEEKASDYRAVTLCNEPCNDADGSAECEANDPLVRFDSFDGGETGLDEHGGYLTTSQRAKETANQIGMSETVAVRARGL